MRAQLLSATGLVAALLTLPAAPAAAQSYGQSQNLPQGSYRNACSNARIDGNGWLTADCPTNAGSWRTSSIRASDCRADIANRDGTLVCTAGLGTGALGQLADALVGGGLNGQGAQPLYQDGYRYPAYGQFGYGDARTDPRFGRDGWGYGRERQWVPIIERRDWFERRIAEGQRQNLLSSRDVTDLRRGFDDLARSETQYARDGLTNSERADLDSRFDQLAARIRLYGSSSGGGSPSWQGIEQRRGAFEAAVSDAQGRNRISRAEAARLRADFEDLSDLEVNYSRNGLDRNEQADLNQRYDALIARTGSTGGGSSGNVWTGPTIADQAALIDSRIEAQRRAGRLTRTDAARLGDDLDALVRLEQDYRRDGLSRQEADDLQRRLRDLEARIGGNGGVITPAVQGPVADRRDGLLGRIDTALRNRRITSSDAARLRNELDELSRLETDYARDGLSAAERSYLESRLSAIEAFLPR